MKKNSLIDRQGKIYKVFSDNKYVILSSLIAFLLTQLVAYCFDLIPYGNMTILRMDLYHQYGPLFGELYDRLTGGESLVYSWNSGLGETFLGNFFNYLSSPFSILVLLFGHKNITEAISCMIMLKAVFSAGTFTYYLKKSLNQHSAFTAGFGVLYAFCGYFVAYYWNLMWLDAIAFFPLVILGIENIINKGKPALYCIMLAVTMVSNYYMAYMVCIFSVLYFLCYYFANYPIGEKFDKLSQNKGVLQKLKNSLFVNSAVKFAFYSFVSACLAAFALLPLITVLSQSSATSGSMPTETAKYFTAFDFLANHLANANPTIRSSGDTVLPNVYCGILTVMLVPLYLYSKKITVREKVSNVVLLAVLYFSFNINIPNFIWHGFHFPNDLPYRFSFMYSFILLTLAVKALINISEYTSRQLLSVGIGVIAFMVLVEKITSVNIDDAAVLFSIVFSVGYVVILYLFKDKRFQASAVSVLLLCTVCSEVALGNTTKYSMNQPKGDYVQGYDDFRQLKSRLDEMNKNNLYRMEVTNSKTTMDPCWLGYNGVSVFSSMAYETVSNLQQQVGLYGNFINSYTYAMQTPVYNSMFGLKYIVKNDESIRINPNLLEEMFSVDDYTVYENKYPLSIAFAVNKAASGWDASIYDNPFMAQAEFFRLASGVNGVFTKLDIENTEYGNIDSFSDAAFEQGDFAFTKTENGKAANVSFEITPEKSQNVYIYIDCKELESVLVSGDGFSNSVEQLSEPHIYDVGFVEAGQSVFVELNFKLENNTGTLKFCAYGLENDKFEQGYKILSQNNFEITKNEETLVSGKLDAKYDGMVFTSIPYDANWRVYVDGKRLDRDSIYKVSDALLAFDITKGEHTVIFNYYPSGLVVGSVISCATIIIATVIIVLKRRKLLFFKKAKKSKWELAEEQNDFVITAQEVNASDVSQNENGEELKREISEAFEIDRAEADMLPDDLPPDDLPQDEPAPVPNTRPEEEKGEAETEDTAEPMPNESDDSGGIS